VSGESPVVFRIELESGRPSLAPDPVAGRSFELLATPPAAFPVLAPLVRRFGGLGTLRTLAKLATRRRRFFCVFEAGEIVSDGWLLIGACDAHPVAPRDVVIGSVHTRPAARGGGRAAWGVRHAIAATAARGHSTFYIHAAAGNAASLRFIAKAGFGAPVELPRAQ